jgi:hypothetical protein
MNQKHEDEQLSFFSPEILNEVETTPENDPFAKGRERMASVSGFFSKIKENASSLFKRVGGSLSRFGSQAKSFGGEAIAATLSADVLAKQGYEAVSDNVVQAQQFVGRKGTEAIDFANQKINQAGEWINEKGD